MKLNYTTISKYLKIGAKIWEYVDYNAQKELENGRKTAKNKISKPVEIFKDGTSLGIFPSCSELSRQSKELFGVKLSISRISDVANEKIEKYKSFTFKFI